MKDKDTSGSRETRRIVVIYENAAIREHAVQFCSKLASEPPMNWWSFSLLAEPAVGNDAARRASTADLIVFATSAKGDLPREIKLWIEDWLGKRGEREGALVSLSDRDELDSSEVLPFKEMYLRYIAHRAGMDFLSHTPPTDSRAMPDSLDSFNDRAGCITATLDEILHTHPQSAPPPLV